MRVAEEGTVLLRTNNVVRVINQETGCSTLAYAQHQRWSPRGHILKSLALASSLVSSTPPLKIILCGDFNFHFETNSADAVKFFNMVDCYGFTPLDSFRSNPTHCKGGILDAFFISKNAMDKNFMKNLDIIQ